MLSNALIDVCDEIESGATLSGAMSKVPKAFDRLYVNMIKAGEAGGALEVILRRLAEFQERSQALRRKVKGAMVYPITVVLFACGILTFIMIKIVPQFGKMFKELGVEMPAMTQFLIDASDAVVHYWYLLPGIPISIWLFIKLMRKFSAGRMGWDLFIIKIPIFGARRKEHRRPHDADPGHPGGQRRAHPGIAAHHQGNLRQRRV